MILLSIFDQNDFQVTVSLLIHYFIS